MGDGREHRRDVALTTLIDLLVQIIFVFTLLLLASGTLDGPSKTLDGPSKEQGYIISEQWKTLISIFNISKDKSVTQQSLEIQSRYKEARNAQAAAERDRDIAYRKVSELDKRIAELEKKAGGPGLPPCRSEKLREITVGAVQIDAAGGISIEPLADAKPFEASGLGMGSSRSVFTRQGFLQMFSGWKRAGLERVPPCQYVVTVEYDPEAPAGQFQPSIYTVWSIFRTSKVTPVREK